MSFKPTQDSKADSLAKLVDDSCTTEDIQDLLRVVQKENPEIRISGSNKADILIHLKDAFLHHGLTEDRILELIRESEDAGEKLIFLYRPASDDVLARCNDSVGVVESLFGSTWPHGTGFPVYPCVPESTMWADFQITALGATLSDWRGKIYSQGEKWTKPEREFDPNSRVETVRRAQILVRESYLIEWHHQGLLEIRIPSARSGEDISTGLDNVWGMLKDLIATDNFEHTDLRRACRKILAEAATEAGKTAYSFFSVEIENDCQIRGNLRTRSQSENLYTFGPIQTIIDGFEKCHHLGVGWSLPMNPNEKPSRLFTIIGKHGQHSVSIRSRANKRGVQYVVDQLRRLA